MIVVSIQTDDLFRVIRKFEQKRARLMIIDSMDTPSCFKLIYSLDEPTDIG